MDTTISSDTTVAIITREAEPDTHNKGVGPLFLEFFIHSVSTRMWEAVKTSVTSFRSTQLNFFKIETLDFRNWGGPSYIKSSFCIKSTSTLKTLKIKLKILSSRAYEICQ